MNNLISLEAQLEKATIGQRVELLANDLVLMEEELETLEHFINKRRKELLDAMDVAGLKSIKSASGAKITVIEQQRYNIDHELAMEAIDSIQEPDIREKMLKVNEAKFRELFPTSRAVTTGKLSRFIKVEKNK